jgi:probable HAF family extracellular repeat protein
LMGTLNLAGAINNRGQVLGESLLPDNATFHSFLWQEGVGTTNLGTLPGNPLTSPAAINNRGQVVGHSCDVTDTFCVAYLWENGVMTDINTLIPPGLSVHLYYAGDHQRSWGDHRHCRRSSHRRQPRFPGDPV